MRLGIVYHMPCFQDAAGALWESEGSFARYVDSLAPYFDEVSLCVPVLPGDGAAGTRIRASNVRLAALPAFDGPKQFYPKVVQMIARIVPWVRQLDVLHCRVPTPAAIVAYAAARAAGKPIFLLVVGDLHALAPAMPYRGWKRWLWLAYTGLEERNIARMTRHALTFANGGALARKHRTAETPVVETKTTTIRESDIATRADTCAGASVRLLVVSRIDPRKGLRCLPAAVAQLRDGGRDVRLDIIGPVVGRAGAAERDAIAAEAERLSIGAFVRCPGAIPLDELLPRYREYDVFVLPTLPGEGIPRVLLEAMAAGLPVVATAVAGIPSLIEDTRNGLLIDSSTSAAVAATVARLLDDGALRRRLIQGGYETARAHTLEAQAAEMMRIVTPWLGSPLRPHEAAAS